MSRGQLSRIFAFSCVACLSVQGSSSLSAPSQVPISSLTSDEITRVLEAGWLRPPAAPAADPETARRAALAAALSNLGPGTAILQGTQTHTPETLLEEISFELLPGKIGYIRLGKVTRERPVQLDCALQDFRQVGVRALVVDLRASSGGDLRIAAELASSFIPRDSPLFSIRQLNTQKTEVVSSTKSPPLAVPITVLVTSLTSGAAEVFGATLQAHTKAFILGQTTAGAAADFTQLHLDADRIFQFPCAAAVLESIPDLFPKGLRPDLPLSITQETTSLILEQAAKTGKIAPFIQETGLPKLNEAALVANQNPETEHWILEQIARKKQPAKNSLSLKDEALRRAIDFIETRSALLSSGSSESTGKKEVPAKLLPPQSIQ